MPIGATRLSQNQIIREPHLVRRQCYRRPDSVDDFDAVPWSKYKDPAETTHRIFDLHWRGRAITGNLFPAQTLEHCVEDGVDCQFRRVFFDIAIARQ